LFENLFSAKLLNSSDKSYYLLAEFISAWAGFERAADDLSSYYHFDDNTNLRTTIGYANELHRNGYLSKAEYLEIKELWAIRNQVVHGKRFISEILTPNMVERIKQITNLVRKRIEDN